MAGHASSDEGEKPTTWITVPSKDLIRSFTDKQKLRDTKPALQQMLKDLLETGNTKRVYKHKPKTIKKMAMGSYLSIITLHKWVECPNQKTKTG